MLIFISGIASAQGQQSPARTGFVLSDVGDAITELRIKNSNGNIWSAGHQSPSGTSFVLSDVGDAITELSLDVSGNLTITGTLTAGNPAARFPDYVFAEDYSLMPLGDLARFVRENRHLPNVPSAQEIAAEGKLNISEFQYRLLEKIEELTLYTLQQQRNIDELRAQVKELQQQNRSTDAHPSDLH